MALTKHLKTACFLAAASTILMASGCAQTSNIQTQQAENDAWHSQNEISDTERLEHTQMAAGARAECTMYPDQFDGSALSSLGMKNLDLILDDSHRNNPIVVYMDVPEDELAEERRLAVGRYLEDRGGLRTEQIEFRAGPNPATYHAADVQLSEMPKTDTSLDGFAGSSSSSGGASAGGGSSSGSSPGH